MCKFIFTFFKYNICIKNYVRCRALKKALKKKFLIIIFIFLIDRIHKRFIIMYIWVFSTRFLYMALMSRIYLYLYEPHVSQNNLLTKLCIKIERFLLEYIIKHFQ